MTTAHAPSKQNGIENAGPIRVSSRLEEGRALALDVWSIYKSVLLPPPHPFSHLFQRCEPSTGLYQPRPGVYELPPAPLDQGSGRGSFKIGRCQSLFPPEGQASSP